MASPNATKSVPFRTWVLGASFGGPKALTEFLQNLADNLPVCLIVAQHIHPQHAGDFCRQLARLTRYPTRLAQTGSQLAAGTILVSPSDKQFTIDASGQLTLQNYTTPPPCHPSIDLLLETVATARPGQCGAIIFSGMGNDGTRGSQTLYQHQGVVWAQSASSSTISSMPDSVRARGIVSYSAPPKQLARQLQVYSLSASTRVSSPACNRGYTPTTHTQPSA